MSHTPAPWFVQADRVEAADGTTVAAFDKFIAPSPADAALIAAAPDLLAALDAMTHYFAQYEKDDSAKYVFKAARIAIAKAGGAA